MKMVVRFTGSLPVRRTQRGHAPALRKRPSAAALPAVIDFIDVESARPGPVPGIGGTAVHARSWHSAARKKLPPARKRNGSLLC